MQTMTAQPTFRRLAGLHYHDETKALHLRLDRHDAVAEAKELAKKGELDQGESLHLTLADGLFQPEHTDQDLLLDMCRALCDSMPRLKEIHIGRALSGFILSDAGAGVWCPVEAIQVLLENSADLQCLMLRNLQVYSIKQRREGIHPSHILARALRGHSSLLRFGWQHNEFGSRSGASLDPMLQSLSTIPNLTSMIIQSPPWTANKVPTDHHVLKALVGHNLQSLHLDGFLLQGQHVRSLLELQISQTSLQSLSLTLHLSLENIQDVGSCLANFLQQSGSSLVHLGLRLEWLAEADQAVNSPSCQKKRLEELQDFQNNIALAIKSDSQLQRLDLIYYDCHRWNESSSSNGFSRNVFQELLQTNFTLIHLRLPFCGEMDPAIDFLLKLNRTGLRQRLLKGDPTRMDCLDALVKMQQSANNSNNGAPESLAKTGFSMLFHLLREMPTIFPS